LYQPGKNKKTTKGLKPDFEYRKYYLKRKNEYKKMNVFINKCRKDEG